MVHFFTANFEKPVTDPMSPRESEDSKKILPNRYAISFSHKTQARFQIKGTDTRITSAEHY